MKTQAELDLELLGPAAVAALEQLVASAPPLSPEQRDAIAVLLGHNTSRDQAA